MTVPFLDLARLHESIRPELDAAFDRVLRDSAFIGGSGRELELAFAAAHGAVDGAGCGSGTDALTLALRALGVGPGDEVVVPAMTFVATAEAVVHCGATPVVADVDPTTLLLTCDTVAAVRTERTAAVLPVHLYGHVVPFDAIAAWRADGLRVVEDGAQAHLATWHDEPVGSRGDAVCFSFYPGKNLGALGDGGMVLAGDQSVVDEVRRLRDHGRTDKYQHQVIGWCSRLDGLQAAVLLVKLAHLPHWTARRQALAEAYAARLGDLLVPWEPGAVHHLLVVRVQQREAVQSVLRAAGIGSGVHYPIALSQQPSTAPFSSGAPVAERAADEVLSLPMDPLMTDAEVAAVCDLLDQAVAASG